MDVLVQHHPEYVSLAWGAMKLVFGVGVLSMSGQRAKNELMYPPGHRRAREFRKDNHHRSM